MKRLYAQHSGQYTVSELCGLFGRSKQAYYQSDADAGFRRLSLGGFATEYIMGVLSTDPGIEGLKMWLMYKREFGEGLSIGRDRFYDIIDRLGLKIRRRKRAVRTTDSTMTTRYIPILSNR